MFFDVSRLLARVEENRRSLRIVEHAVERRPIPDHPLVKLGPW
jgi:hypothetical protein